MTNRETMSHDKEIRALESLERAESILRCSDDPVMEAYGREVTDVRSDLGETLIDNLLAEMAEEKDSAETVQCEDCGRTIKLKDGITESFPGYEGRVILALCPEFAEGYE